MFIGGFPVSGYYIFIGKIVILFFLIIVLFILFALALGIYTVRSRKIVFPTFVLFMLYLFYSPVKWVFDLFSMNDLLVDEILIEIQNAVNLEKFKKRTERKVVLLPQCLRNSECRARCDPLYGFVCIKCGRCDIGTIMDEAEKREFKVFVVPGSSFVKKIFKEYRPTSCIGVACPVELSESMQKTTVVPSQGVYLINNGCFETKVDVGDIISKMELVSPIPCESGTPRATTLYDFEDDGGLS
ncbi:MAG: DUF116 domain-containing protein [Methanosarcinales archaeon]|jgi:hypothetical protein|nr:DUF116 domain-containing protein [Methanosarcinales archaeon]